MKNYRNKFFILIATILLGFLIVTNIGINENNGFLNLNSVEYREAIEERNKLYEEITVLSYDGEYDINKDDQLEVDRRTLHSVDAAMVLNDLKTAGAEAIAINSYRILNTTGLVCAWAFIRFEENGNEMEGSPFKFYVIGDPDQLEASLLTEGSHINRLIIRKLNITIEKFDEIILPEAKKSIEPKFMERADN